MAHDDILHNETSQDALDPVDFVSIDLSNSPIVSNATANSDPTTSQYHVTMEDGEEAETGNSFFLILFTRWTKILNHTKLDNKVI